MKTLKEKLEDVLDTYVPRHGQIHQWPYQKEKLVEEIMRLFSPEKRKGKERKGKERKGKERKGKERNENTCHKKI